MRLNRCLAPLLQMIVEARQVFNALHDFREHALGEATPCGHVCDHSILNTVLGNACPESMHSPQKIMLWSEFTKSLALDQDKPKIVTIPNDYRIDLDQSPPILAGLYVRGHLRIKDGIDIELRTGFIYVCGVMNAGTPSTPHFSMLKIQLLGGFPPLIESGIDYGTRAFVVFGGLIYLRSAVCSTQQRDKSIENRKIYHGPQIYSYLTWTRLASSAFPGDTEIELIESPPINSPHWQAGARLVITSTDWDDIQNEQVHIASVKGNIVQLQNALAFAHFGSNLLPAAEVATLTRNIIITSDKNCEKGDHRQLAGPKPMCGHFIISHTPRGFICGIEFTRLGATSTFGKYPLHAYMCGSAKNLSIRANSIHHNYNRALVIDSTSDATIAHNVAYHTSGHMYCFNTGLEIRNMIYENIGMGTFAPVWYCPGTSCGGGDQCGFGTRFQELELCASRDDKHANAFWIANPQNDFIGNVAVGGVRSAFSVSPIISGPLVSTINTTFLKSIGLPRHTIAHLLRDRSNKNRASKLLEYASPGKFIRNVAHSTRFGFNVSPAWTPRDKAAEWLNLTAYKIFGSAIRLKTRCATTDCFRIEGMTVIAANMIARARDIFSRFSFRDPQLIQLSNFDDLSFVAGGCLSVSSYRAEYVRILSQGIYTCRNTTLRLYDVVVNATPSRRSHLHCTTCDELSVSWPPREIITDKKTSTDSIDFFCPLATYAFNYDHEAIEKGHTAEKCTTNSLVKSLNSSTSKTGSSCYNPQEDAPWLVNLETTISVDKFTLSSLLDVGFSGLYPRTLTKHQRSRKKYEDRQPDIQLAFASCLFPKPVFGSFHLERGEEDTEIMR